MLSDNQQEEDNQQCNDELLTENTNTEKPNGDVNTTEQFVGRMWPQIRIAIVVSVLCLSTGFMIGFTGVVLPQMRVDEDLKATEEECSWIASFPALSSFFGAILGSVTVDRFGRKKGLYACGIFDLIGWLCVALAPGMPVLYAGRAFNGIALGLSCTLVYQSEISSSNLKEVLCSCLILSVHIGCVIVSAIGAYVWWRTVAYIAATMPFIFIILIFFEPDSPSWLLMNGQEKRAKTALTRLRGKKYDVTGELDLIKKKQMEINALRSNIWAKATSPVALKPLTLMAGLFLFKDFAGNAVLLNYALDIFQDVVGDRMDPKLILIIISAERALALVVATVALRFVRIRPVLIGSSILTSISMFVIGTYMYLEPTLDKEVDLTWIPLLALMGYTATYTVGLGMLPWMLIGQIFPLSLRGLFSCAMTCLASGLGFLVVKTFTYMVNAIGLHGSFWFYGSAAIIAAVYVYFLFPETKGKSLQEIEDYFGRKKSQKSKKNHASA